MKKGKLNELFKYLRLTCNFTFDSFINDIEGYLILTLYFRKTQNESDMPPIISNKKSKARNAIMPTIITK